MSCEIVDHGETRLIICTTSDPCFGCGGVASRLCDGSRGDGTCDHPLCESCATSGPAFKGSEDHKDFCPDCAATWNVVRLPPRVTLEARSANAMTDPRDMVASPRTRRRCPRCPGPRRPRATHVGRANGMTMMVGCEWHVRMWVRDPMMGKRKL